MRGVSGLDGDFLLFSFELNIPKINHSGEKGYPTPDIDICISVFCIQTYAWKQKQYRTDHKLEVRHSTNS